MKNKTVLYIVGGASALGLAYLVIKKMKTSPSMEELQAKILTGEVVPVDSDGKEVANIMCITAPCGSVSAPTVINKDQVKSLPVAVVKEIAKSNPEIMKDVTPAQAVEIIDSTPEIKKIIPAPVQTLIRQQASAPTPTPKPVATVIKEVTKTSSASGGGTEIKALDRREMLRGLGTEMY